MLINYLSRNKTLHIVSFDVPYPANYGGVIDIFYRIKALHSLGIQIILHCYTYGRLEQAELEKYCLEVNYYKRKINRNPFYGQRPYIVKTRQDSNLIKRLLTDDHPILFEGLHTTYFINHASLKNRLKIVRTHNIEHTYYMHLGKVENNILKRFFFQSETKKLKNYEKILHSADIVAAISPKDTKYFNSKYNNAFCLPPAHQNTKVNGNIGKGEFILYHGNLSVGENNVAALYLCQEIFSKVKYPCIIAGNNPSKELKAEIEKHHNIKLVSNTTTEHIHQLIKDAHINVLYTFQATGVKLKLLNALYSGRHCLVNPKMVEGTNLKSVCKVSLKTTSLIKNIEKYMKKEFTAFERSEREKVLSEYDTEKSAALLVEKLKNKPFQETKTENHQDLSAKKGFSALISRIF